MTEGDGRFQEIVRRIQGGDTDLVRAVAEELGKITVPERSETGPYGSGTGWYVIRAELVSGQAQKFDPPPGRDFLISPQHSFRQFAEAINAAFARWDLGHLYAFRFADGLRIGTAFEDPSQRDAARTKVAKRLEGEVFDYEFDFGDSWLHRCTVLEVEVQPEDIYGVRPKGPVAVWGWGAVPDQYGRTTPDS